MYNDINPNQDPQIVLTGRIEPNKGGGEMIKFCVNLGLFQLKCIVNVPGEGETEAPVYIKFRIKNSEPKPASQPQVVKARPRRAA